jgi:hypothetical protein
MKLKTTKKQIRENANQLYSVGYCELDRLLVYQSPFAYSSGVYGWSCDYYKLNGVVISTGYSPIGESIAYDLQKKYNNLAKETHSGDEMSKLLQDFLNELTKKKDK